MRFEIAQMQGFGYLEKAEKSAFMRQLISTLHDDNAYQSIICAAAMNNAWAFLTAYLMVPRARESLWEIIDDIQAMAYRADRVSELSGCLPRRFRPKEALRALIVPVLVKSGEMTADAFDRGAIPGEDLFHEVCASYTNKPDEFYKKFIKRVAKNRTFDWKKVLAFPDYADGFDIIKRADKNDTSANYVVASAVMTAPEKQRLISNISDTKKLLKYLEHMEFPKKWQRHLTMDMKAKIFKSDLGL